MNYQTKRDWVLAYLRKHTQAGTFDDVFHEEWHREFGGRLIVYTMGPNRCPAAVRTLRRMWEDKEITRRVVGNQDARYYCQPSWSIVYSLIL